MKANMPPLFVLFTMKIKIFIFLTVLVLVFTSCKTNIIKQENNYAIKMMRLSFDKEAEFRWQQLIKENDRDWIAHNNLGVCLEKQGKYDEALLEYETALSIVKKNKGVEKNYERLSKKINEGTD
jgi:tetratricopeptide (TPR) repeat protein